MGEKEGKKKGGGDDKKGDGGKKDKEPITIVLKVDMHCQGCAKKLEKSVKNYEGVDFVKANNSRSKLTVVGKVDPEKVRSRVEMQTTKKVDLVSPAPKKEKDGRVDKKKDTPAKKVDDKKKPAETTVVLKTRLDCDGCIQKVRQKIDEIRGVELVSIDSEKHLVMVRGTKDTKELLSCLKEKLNRSVEIVPPEKHKEDGGDKKGGRKKGNGGDQGKAETDRMDDGSRFNTPVYIVPGYTPGYYAPGYHAPGYTPVYSAPGYPAPSYTPVYSAPGYYNHAPQAFSDENPNSCSVM